MARLRIEGTAKAIAIFAVILIVSTGLCGATSFLSGKLDSYGSLVIPLGIVELIGMMVGAVGLLGSLAVAIIDAIRHRFGGGDGAVRRDLMGDDNEGDKR